MSKYDYFCEFYKRTHRVPSEKELARYILFGIKGE